MPTHDSTAAHEHPAAEHATLAVFVAHGPAVPEQLPMGVAQPQPGSTMQVFNVALLGQRGLVALQTCVESFHVHPVSAEHDGWLVLFPHESERLKQFPPGGCVHEQPGDAAQVVDVNRVPHEEAVPQQVPAVTKEQPGASAQAAVVALTLQGAGEPKQRPTLLDPHVQPATARQAV